MSFNAQIAAGFARLITAINKLHATTTAASGGRTLAYGKNGTPGVVFCKTGVVRTRE